MTSGEPHFRAELLQATDFAPASLPPGCALSLVLHFTRRGARCRYNLDRTGSAGRVCFTPARAFLVRSPHPTDTISVQLFAHAPGSSAVTKLAEAGEPLEVGGPGKEVGVCWLDLHSCTDDIGKKCCRVQLLWGVTGPPVAKAVGAVLACEDVEEVPTVVVETGAATLPLPTSTPTVPQATSAPAVPATEGNVTDTPSALIPEDPSVQWQVVPPVPGPSEPLPEPTLRPATPVTNHPQSDSSGDGNGNSGPHSLSPNSPTGTAAPSPLEAMLTSRGRHTSLPSVDTTVATTTATMTASRSSSTPPRQAKPAPLDASTMAAAIECEAQSFCAVDEFHSGVLRATAAESPIAKAVDLYATSTQNGVPLDKAYSNLYTVPTPLLVLQTDPATGRPMRECKTDGMLRGRDGARGGAGPAALQWSHCSALETIMKKKAVGGVDDTAQAGGPSAGAAKWALADSGPARRRVMDDLFRRAELKPVVCSWRK